MSFKDWFSSGAKSPTDIIGVTDSLRFAYVDGLRVDLSSLLGQTTTELWRSQPYLRTVVTFLARNIAQLGLHTFERLDESDRRRSRDNVVARLLASPNPTMTTYELINSLVSDMALADNAYWYINQTTSTSSGWQIQPIPAEWVSGMYGKDAFVPDGYVVNPPDRGSVKIDAAQVLHFHGWDPSRTKEGTSPVETLKLILKEQVTAWAMRQQRGANGDRVGAVLTRPAGVQWSPEARNSFRADWRSKYTGNEGSDAGGTPILEDGMTLTQVGFSPRDNEFADSAKLALQTVASVYHVNPTMIGLLDNANYSNVREFRRMLYGDTLGPIMAQIEGRLNTFLLPMIGAPENLFVEFNIAEKLEGSFEEQAAVMSTLVGGPVLTVNEGRAKFNLPRIEGQDADKLIVPMNVTVGGQASPRDSAPKSLDPRFPYFRVIEGSKDGQVQTKARPDGAEDEAAAVLRKFFKRQRKAVLSALGSKAATDWWDESRWDEELASDLYDLAMKVTAEVATSVLASIDLKPDRYNAEQTQAFLLAVAQSRAGAINSTTRDEITAALESDNEDVTPSTVFDSAENERSLIGGVTLVTTFAAFATNETAKQVSGDSATKTWVVTSRNPRSSHAEMDGETVGINDSFSNGANWPGDPVLGAEGVSGCQCTIEVQFA